MSNFEKNGGYFIDGVPYMDCKITGDPVRNVSVESKSVIGSIALHGILSKKFPDESKPKNINIRRRTKRLKSWMKEFVDKDGTVYHLGKGTTEVERYYHQLKVTPLEEDKEKNSRRDTFEEMEEGTKEKDGKQKRF